MGATYPELAERLRKLSPKSYFLVPGFGAQGGNAQTLRSFFNEDGLGAVINSSRGIIFSYLNKGFAKDSISKTDYIKSLREATLKTKDQIKDVLK